LDVTGAPGGLDILKRLFERPMVGGAEGDWRLWRLAACPCQAEAGWSGAGEHAGAGAREDRRGAAKQPNEEAHQKHQQQDLQQEAEEAAEAHHAAPESMTQQQPREACADEAAHEAGRKAGAGSVTISRRAVAVSGR
jgi:hypothetical protein